MTRKIKFKGEDFILVGDTDGAIAKIDDYRHGRASFAHLHPSGEVVRFDTIIGSRSDVELGENVEIELADDAWVGLFSGPGWGVNPGDIL